MISLALVMLLAAPRCSGPMREGCAVADRILQESPADATTTYLAYLSALDGEADDVADRRAARRGLAGAVASNLPEIDSRADAAAVGVGVLAVTGFAVGTAIHDRHVARAIPGREAQARGALETVYQREGDGWADLLPLLYQARPTDEDWREELRARSEQAEADFEQSIFDHVGEDAHPTQDPSPTVWIRTQQNGLQDVEVGLSVSVALVGGGPRLGGTITAASEQEIVLDGQRTIPVADIAYVLWTP